MNYRFSNLLGAPYRGGNVVLHGNELLSPVGNRVSQVGSAYRPAWMLPRRTCKCKHNCITVNSLRVSLADQSSGIDQLNAAVRERQARTCAL